MTAQVRLKIEGDGVSRESLPLGDLIHVLNNFNRAIESLGAKGRISLVDIADGSAELVFDPDDASLASTNRVLFAINNRSPEAIPPRTRRFVRKIWTRARERGWAIELSTRNGKAPVVARLTPATAPFADSKATGLTSQLIYVTRVGGEDSPTAQVMLGDGKTLTARLATREIAVELGKRLFQWIEARGVGQWLAGSMELCEFRIKEVGPYRERESNPRETLDALYTASKGIWDHIDPEELVRMHRSDDWSEPR